MAMLILDKVDFRTSNTIKGKEGYYIVIKESIIKTP